MKRRRKAPVRAYYVISLICLIVLFIGYGFIFNLSEKRKEGKEVKTISLVDESENLSGKYNKLFAKLMSYFNIFFKETFKEYDENGMFEYKMDDDLNGGIVAVESGVVTSIDNIELYSNSDYDASELYKTTVLLASNRKRDFFTIVSGYDIASRLGISAKDLKTEANKVNEKYKITIYHTHATEAYNNCSKTNFRSENDKENVVCIGNIISENLENNGINTIHLVEHNDMPSYNKSYINSKKLVTNNLDKTKKNIIIDIHRDGADAESNYEKLLESVTRLKMNDRYIATYAIIIGGANENLDELKIIANTVKSVSDELYPGLCRGIIIREGAYFNQNISEYAMLLEVGCHLNTLDEAKVTSDYLSEILCKSFLKLN
ncbi:stage II sporulation protein P [Sedimentibacter sp. zth1]|uniref:stage II sporulation protein P n=1 Tax=Sedimentibacter sp. zth1 TaxID=2816908 RepID=UPI001A90F7E7|nr:stage II sporulation protein P [Sedimentibacter sp. zth1]QSX07092.1 stage II sporulation protein P [Sedimentibacter sp. zth1]